MPPDHVIRQELHPDVGLPTEVAGVFLPFAGRRVKRNVHPQTPVIWKLFVTKMTAEGVCAGEDPLRTLLLPLLRSAGFVQLRHFIRVV